MKTANKPLKEAVVTRAFSAPVDGGSRKFTPGDVVTGTLATRAVRQGNARWVKASSSAPETKSG